jgi:hypothetical protein
LKSMKIAPFILKKLNVNVYFIQVLDSTIQGFPKVSGGEVMLSRDAKGVKRSRNYCKENER